MFTLSKLIHSYICTSMAIEDVFTTQRYAKSCVSLEMVIS